MTKLLTAAVMVAAFTTSALAQSFYIVQDVKTKRCTIVREKPTTTTMIIVGDGKVYTSETEAQTAIRTVKVCETQ